ncbi:MAG: hypothetical protein ACREBS_03405 [Nitrososphaerales archaeon]
MREAETTSVLWMVSTGTVFAVVAIVIIILIGAAVALFYFVPGLNKTSSTSNTTSSSTSTTFSTSPIITSTSSTTTTSYSSTSASSSSSSSSTTSTTNTPTSYALQLLQSTPRPVLNSSLTTNVTQTFFRSDGLGGDCGSVQCYTFNYTDNGNPWVVQGDFEPGAAWLSANSSGFTMTDQACSSPGNPLKVCGPYWEWNGDKRVVNGVITGEENVSELSAALYGVPSTADVFSIYLAMPKYDFSSCVLNTSSTGCSFEGTGPSITGIWALDAGPNSVAVSLSQAKTGIYVGISTASFLNGQYQPSLSKNLNASVPFFPTFSPNHKLTIATDRHSYFEVWVDNTLEYSSTKMPVDLSQSGIALNFYQFDNVNNMTLSTTWKNFTAYSSSFVTVVGLSPAMSIVVNGTNGFSGNANANSTGIAVVDVSDHPTDLQVSVELNGKIVVTYGTTVGAGAQLRLITQLLG